MRRRDVLRRLGLAGGLALLSRQVQASQPRRRVAKEGRRLEYVGWQVGVTYQTRVPGGLDRDDLMRLLDEMARHRMNLLSLMMISYGYYDPEHDGYPWPVQNKKLRCYADARATNADPSSEFVREILAAAGQRKIAVQLMMNWGIWNPTRIREQYPDACLQMDRCGRPTGWLHCPDSPGAWQLGLDEVTDLLSYYDHPNVGSYAFERISYSGKSACACDHTKRAYREATGKELLDALPAAVESWKNRHIAGYLGRYVQHIKTRHPRQTVWLHTQCSPGWGHDPARLRQCGVDYLLPHVIQFPETRESLHRKWQRMAPNKLVLHFCTRDRRPTNYKLWIKTPEIIARAIDWTLDYPGDNLSGLLFFNETATSPSNKREVYEQIKRFDWS